MSKQECGIKSHEWRNAFPRHVALVDGLSPELIHDNLAKLLATSFVEQTRRPLSPAQSYVLAEDGQEMVVDVICNALSNQPDVKNGWSSRAALEGHVEEVRTMLAPFPKDSSTEKTIAVAEMFKAFLELQKQGIFDPNHPRAVGVLKPGIDLLAKAIDLSGKEGKRRPAIFLPVLSLSSKPAFS